MLLLLVGVASAASPCDTSKSESVAASLAKLDVERRVDLAAAWLSESCKLPSALDEVLGAWASYPPDLRPMVAAKAVTEDPVLLVASCAGGPRVFANVISVAPNEKRGLLFDGCELGRHGVDRAAFVAASAGDPMVYTLAAEALKDVSDPGIRAALRALAGLK